MDLLQGTDQKLKPLSLDRLSVNGAGPRFLVASRKHFLLTESRQEEAAFPFLLHSFTVLTIHESSRWLAAEYFLRSRC